MKTGRYNVVVVLGAVSMTASVGLSGVLAIRHWSGGEATP